MKHRVCRGHVNVCVLTADEPLIMHVAGPPKSFIL